MAMGDNMACEQGVESARSKYPFPNVDGIMSCYYSLDGGGRDLVVDLLHQVDAKLMVEIGCFLGGSSRQWLDAKKDLTVVGVDPWVGPWHETLQRYRDTPVMQNTFNQVEDPDAFIASLKVHGPYMQAMANLKEHRSRFIPVQDTSPAILPTLLSLGIYPDVVYVDSVKHHDDLIAIDNIWPNAEICGDDWTWGADQGYPMRIAVQQFAAAHGYEIEAKRATWVLRK